MSEALQAQGTVSAEDVAVITPRGQDVIQAGDAVVVVSKRLGMQDITDVLK